MISEAQQKIINRLVELLTLVRSKTSTQFPDPALTFELKGTIGGQADIKKWEIRINLPLAEKNLEYYLNQVVAHELAHLLDWTFYKKVGHGRTWKAIMRSIFGLRPDRCHSLDVSEVKLKKYDTFLYKCACAEGHKIKPNKHNKIQNLKIRIGCARCRKILVFVEYIGKT